VCACGCNDQPTTNRAVFDGMNGGDYDGTATEVYQMRTACLEISNVDIFNGIKENETAVFFD
jgi:hypothetical protein